MHWTDFKMIFCPFNFTKSQWPRALGLYGGTQPWSDGYVPQGSQIYHPVLEWKIPESIPCSGAKRVNHISCSGVTTPSLNQMYCIVLYCIVLYCIVLYCIVLYCIVLYCIVLYCIVLYWRQRPYLCFTSLIKWCYHSTLVLPCLREKSFKFSITAISLSYDICNAFQN